MTCFSLFRLLLLPCSCLVVAALVVLLPSVLGVSARRRVLSPLGHWSEGSLWEARVKIGLPSTCVVPLAHFGGLIFGPFVGKEERQQDELGFSSSGGCSRLEAAAARIGKAVCRAYLKSIIWSSAAGMPISTKAWSHILSKVLSRVAMLPWPSFDVSQAS
ncbi:hypothetical protein F2Q69_00060964 [Brassica cretica]|uniref:Secreted protein n=1 Tax=Brassica cretica TaxID=69181 RepID=A0A8S9RAY9_BRACR|nr:hypothetical protein F2Q69_00060964 [Brassica cretica]